jgi:branched-chain amino acid transport system substrate-binding protein
VNGLGWKPKIFVNAVSSASNVMVLSSSQGKNKRVEGSISIVFLKDPNDPKWTKDPAVLLYRKIMKSYARGSNIKDVYNLYGMSVGVHVRRRAQARGQEARRGRR